MFLIYFHLYACVLAHHFQNTGKFIKSYDYLCTFYNLSTQALHLQRQGKTANNWTPDYPCILHKRKTFQWIRIVKTKCCSICEMIFTYIRREFEHKMIENVSCFGPK